jgi:hypothetical protein
VTGTDFVQILDLNPLQSSLFLHYTTSVLINLISLTAPGTEELSSGLYLTWNPSPSTSITISSSNQPIQSPPTTNPNHLQTQRRPRHPNNSRLHLRAPQQTIRIRHTRQRPRRRLVRPLSECHIPDNGISILRDNIVIRALKDLRHLSTDI